MLPCPLPWDAAAQLPLSPPPASSEAQSRLNPCRTCPPGNATLSPELAALSGRIAHFHIGLVDWLRDLTGSGVPVSALWTSAAARRQRRCSSICLGGAGGSSWCTDRRSARILAGESSVVTRGAQTQVASYWLPAAAGQRETCSPRRRSTRRPGKTGHRLPVAAADGSAATTTELSLAPTSRGHPPPLLLPQGPDCRAHMAAGAAMVPPLKRRGRRPHRCRRSCG